MSVGFRTPAFAETSECLRIVVEADEGVRARWPELPSRVRQAVDGREGLDHCARVSLGTTNDTIAIDVSLADGRWASRTVPEREDVVPMIEALLLVPREQSSAAPSESSLLDDEFTAESDEGVVKTDETTPEPVEVSPLSSGDAREEPMRDSARVPLQDRLGIEFSLVTRARIGDRQDSLGLGALSFLDISAWLAGVELRVDDYYPVANVPRTMPALALLGGRRFRAGSVSVDLIAGPALSFQQESTTETRATGRVEATTSQVIPRFVCGSHLNFGASSVLRGFVGIEGDIGAKGSSLATQSDGSSPLPPWMVGVALGATVGTR